MRRVLVGVTLTLLFLISTWNASIGSLDDNQEMNARARDANIVIAELFVSPNNLVANETSDNVYGSVDWNGDGDYGKVIGKRGRNVSAIRTILFAINAKEGGKRARLELMDDGE